MSDWWTRKIQGGPPARVVAPTPPYQQPPPPGYPPPPAAYNVPGYPPPQMPPSPYQQQYPQPVPGAPPHAPFGFDQATGAPVAPYGYDAAGHIMLQPPQPVPQQQYVPPPTQAYAPNGLPAAYPTPSAPVGWVPDGRGGWAPGQPTVVASDANGQPLVHYWDAAMHFHGGAGSAQVGSCPNCGGPLVPRDGGVNVGDGQSNTVMGMSPAPECATCGYNGKFQQMGSGMDTSGMSVQVDGPPRAARGAASLAQVAGQHGLKNLFAPKQTV